MLCTKCKEDKPAELFAKDKRKISGYSSFCKACHVAASKAWQAANQDKVNATRKARYARKKASGTLPKRTYNAALTLEKNRLLRYRVNASTYQSMLAAQNWKCAICLRPAAMFKRPLSVDHDHACCPTTPTCGKCNRGLLCTSCNTGIHSIERDTGWLLRAMAYLGTKHD